MLGVLGRRVDNSKHYKEISNTHRWVMFGSLRRLADNSKH